MDLLKALKPQAIGPPRHDNWQILNHGDSGSHGHSHGHLPQKTHKLGTYHIISTSELEDETCDKVSDISSSTKSSNDSAIEMTTEEGSSASVSVSQSCRKRPHGSASGNSVVGLPGMTTPHVSVSRRDSMDCDERTTATGIQNCGGSSSNGNTSIQASFEKRIRNLAACEDLDDDIFNSRSRQKETGTTLLASSSNNRSSSQNGISSQTGLTANDLKEHRELLIRNYVSKKHRRGDLAVQNFNKNRRKRKAMKNNNCRLKISAIYRPSKIDHYKTGTIFRCRRTNVASTIPKISTSSPVAGVQKSENSNLKSLVQTGEGGEVREEIGLTGMKGSLDADSIDDGNRKLDNDKNIQITEPSKLDKPMTKTPAGTGSAKAKAKNQPLTESPLPAPSCLSIEVTNSGIPLNLLAERIRLPRKCKTLESYAED